MIHDGANVSTLIGLCNSFAEFYSFINKILKFKLTDFMISEYYLEVYDFADLASIHALWQMIHQICFFRKNKIRLDGLFAKSDEYLNRWLETD